MKNNIYKHRVEGITSHEEEIKDKAQPSISKKHKSASTQCVCLPHIHKAAIYKQRNNKLYYVLEAFVYRWKVE